MCTHTKNKMENVWRQRFSLLAFSHVPFWSVPLVPARAGNSAHTRPVCRGFFLPITIFREILLLVSRPWCSASSPLFFSLALCVCVTVSVPADWNFRPSLANRACCRNVIRQIEIRTRIVRVRVDFEIFLSFVSCFKFGGEYKSAPILRLSSRVDPSFLLLLVVYSG